MLVDWSQNNAAKTTIAPYSLRGQRRPTSPRRAPGTRSEAGAERPGRLEQLQMDEVQRRVSRDGDLFGQLLHG